MSENYEISESREARPLNRTEKIETLQYLIYAFGLAWACQISGCMALLHAGNSIVYAGMLVLTMFCPLAAVVLVKKVHSKQPIGLNWKPEFRGRLDFWVLAFWGPAVLTLLGAALYFLVFPAPLDWGLAALDAQLETTGLTGQQYLIITAFSALTYAPVVNMLAAVGEEAGWRGFLSPRLRRQFGPVKGRALMGLIWGVWHWPLMLLVGYEYGSEYFGAPFTGLALWCVVCFALGTLLDWMYAKTGCIWGPALLHGAFNAQCSLALLVTKTEYADQMLLGPTPIGAIGMLPMLAAAVLICARDARKAKQSTRNAESN
jgi:membrane protease YdiL (CAAX protease family)